MADEEKKEDDAASHQIASTGEVVADKEVKSGKPLMTIKVYAPFKVYYEGEAESLTAENETGPFDILPKHHNFLCMLIPCELVIKTPFDVQKIKISRALMHVKAEKVTVFVDV
jgi:F0F1-type ATP synthase epsilon subunit